MQLVIVLGLAVMLLTTWHIVSSTVHSATHHPTTGSNGGAQVQQLGLIDKLNPRSSKEQIRTVPPRVVPASDTPFYPSRDPLPVHHEEAKMLYHNYPLSRHRPPSTQFLLSPTADFSTPLLAIITATMNPRRAMLTETMQSLFGQSFQNFVWVIVSDHTTEPDSISMLQELARDPRVIVIENQGHSGLAQGRNVGLRHLLKDKARLPKYIMPLDDDDLFELTALEKLVWMMESNPTWSLGGYPFIKWGPDTNETVTTGLHSGDKNWLWDNYVPNAAVYTSHAVVDSGCMYDEVNYRGGGEDWDFWMCLAEHDHWGGTAQEFLYWYRMNPKAFRASRWGDTFKLDSAKMSLKEKVQTRHAKLETEFPHRFPEKSVHLEPISWNPPSVSNIIGTDRSIVFVVPWLYLGGADIGLLHMVQTYAEAGFRVTVIATLFKKPEGIELRPEIMKWTHDVHILPAFLRPNDFPRYIKHLIESRGAREVIFSNSQLIYEMLPALTVELPYVKFIDYLHNEAYDGWKSGGYPRYSLISQRYLARTITCSHYLKQWLLDRGHLDESRIGVVKLGIDMPAYEPIQEEARRARKAELLGLDPETVVITFVGRLDPQKRPQLVPAIARALLDKIDEDFVLIMLGGGHMHDFVEGEIVSSRLSDYVRLLGSKDNVHEYLAASDIFLLPSMSEGISIAVAEAMAMALPIVTANAGALPEQLGVNATRDLGGVIVDHILDDDQDAMLYADALSELVTDESKRIKLGRNARKLVEVGFDWHQTLKGLFRETRLAKNLPGHPHQVRDGFPHPAAYYAVQSVLLENWQISDFAGNYPGIWGNR
ncbi:hypothetical protein OIO90_000593 [Microbotryomycetes sp. JL221]|nr:hypothetical protein OIO90_000593 [Microbotryomycetes sp. JL221]